MTKFDVVIVGAGHGGAQVGIALRQARFAGTIAIIGSEPELPYERPPLSKEYAAGERAFERMLIRPATFWQDRAITMMLGCEITALDPVARTVFTKRAETIGYRHLIWATGGSPRQLTCPGHDLAGVHTLRTRADADQLTRELPGTTRAVIVGGGYIGLEAAAVLTGFGKEVVVIEALPRVLSRTAGETLSRFYEKEHRAHGVDVRLGTAVERLLGVDRVNGVRLSNGEVVSAEMVIVGVGIVPAVEPLVAAGAAGGNGVKVDLQCRTTLPDIFAIGDCALHPNEFADGQEIRLESVQNANDQATTVAKVISGEHAVYRAVPWFWSNQYDLKLQTVGLSAGHDAAIVRGDPATRSFSVIYLRRGRVIAIDCVNAVRDYVQGRKLIEARAAPDISCLANTRIPLKEFAVN